MRVWPFRLFIAAVIVALTVPRIAQVGMFGDGLLYAVVARNMSLGVGSFWYPVVTPTTFTGWFEHPPLGYGLQAIAFRLFGDGLAVERVYALAMLAATALVMIAIWRLVRERGTDWVPLLFWILPSTVTWATVNNMLENTQTLFTTVAVWLVMLAATGSRIALWSIAAGVATLAAVLIKGPVGLFPIGAAVFTPFLPSRPRVKTAVAIAAIMTTIVGVALALLWSLPAPHAALAGYLDTQLLPALQGRREVNGDPLAALRHLGLGVVARMTVIAALFWIFGRRHLRDAAGRTPAWFFFAAALGGSLPIAISPKLAGHYFLPSVPFFALGFAALVAAPAMALVTRSGARTRAVLTTIAAALLAAAVIVPVVHGAIEPRDVALVESLRAISPSMPRETTIGACEHEATNWRLHGYISRLFRDTLDPAGVPRAGWMLIGESACDVPPACSVAAKGSQLTLLRCQ